MTLKLPCVWPPCAYLTAALVLHALFVGGIFFCCTVLAGMTSEQTDSIFAAAAPFPLMAAALAYGVFRVVAFHPALRDAYRKWLSQTPWNHTRPLPLGPIHLVWQDAVLLAVAVGLSWPFYGAQGVIVVQMFLIVYVFFLFLSLVATQEYPSTFAVGFGMGAMVVWWSKPAAFVVVAALTYWAGWLGLRRSLISFPWKRAREPRADLNLFGGFGLFADLEDQPKMLGWPFDYLSPRAHWFDLTRAKAALIALLGGWWFYALCTAIMENAPRKNAIGIDVPILLIAIPAMAFLRERIYRHSGRTPPLSLSGRFGLGRWIIPSYDGVFVAPLLILACGFGLPWAVHVLGGDSLVVNAIAFSLALAVALMVGPDRQTWELTAERRVVPGIFSNRPPNLI
jgi:hypothetical protein